MPGLTENTESTPRKLLYRVSKSGIHVHALVIVREEGEFVITEESERLPKASLYADRDEAIAAAQKIRVDASGM